MELGFENMRIVDGHFCDVIRRMITRIKGSSLHILCNCFVFGFVLLLLMRHCFLLQIRNELYGCENVTTALYTMSDAVCLQVVEPLVSTSWEF